jgi:hypothetical protein
VEKPKWKRPLGALMNTQKDIIKMIGNMRGNVCINVTLRHVCISSVAVEKQYYIF